MFLVFLCRPDRRVALMIESGTAQQEISLQTGQTTGTKRLRCLRQTAAKLRRVVSPPVLAPPCYSRLSWRLVSPHPAAEKSFMDAEYRPTTSGWLGDAERTLNPLDSWQVELAD